MEPWKQQIEDVLKLVPGYNPWDQADGAWLDHRAALDAINFFPGYLKHVEGDAVGKPFILCPWQAAIVGNLFGWKRKDDKDRIVRRYRKAFIYVPKGNGKTPMAAGLVLCCFFTDNERGAQNYLAAGQKEQAGFLFRNVRGMVEQEPWLKDQVRVYAGDQHRSMVMHADPLSFVKTIPADAAGQHGGIPHVTVVDELHVQKNRYLVDHFETSMAKGVRAQPLLVMITTADFERESICNEMYAHACRVRDNGGKKDLPGFDPYFLPVVYETAAEDDWTDEKTWRRANPNFGVSVSLDGFRDLCKKAQENPLFENEFLRLNLNRRTKQDVKVISTADWDAQPLETPTITLESLAGRDCFLGADLAATDDLASVAVAFPFPDDWLAVLSFSWCPEQRIVRRARQKFPYDVWATQGYEHKGLPNFLTATDGDWIDYRRIRDDIKLLGERFNIVEIAYDPWGATQFAQDLADDGFTICPIKQTFENLSNPTKDLIRRIKCRKVIHFGNPVLKWAIGNAAAKINGKLPPGARLDEHLDKVQLMLSKAKSTDKIDPAAALVDALARVAEHPQDFGSAYESRGIRTV